jgi:hypothetical protein
MSRHTPLLLLALAAAAGGVWYLMRSGEAPAQQEFDFGGDGTGRPGEALRAKGPLTARASDEAPPYFEIAVEGAQPLHTAIQARAMLTISVPPGSRQLSGAAVLDALAAQVRVRFDSAADAAEFRRRSGHPPQEPEGGRLEVSIDMFPVLIDAMGFIPEEQDGILFLKRPTHTLIDAAAGPR